MTDVTWRPLRADDGARWLELVTAIEQVDHFGESYGPDDFEELTTAPGFDAERDAVAVIDAGDAMVAFGWAEGTAAPTPDAYRVDLRGGVHPAWRGRGIGRALLAWTEERGAALHVERHPGLPGIADVRVVDHQSDRMALCMRAGYEPHRHWFDMERVLAEVDGPTATDDLPPGLRLVAFDWTLDASAHQTRNESFADHWGSVERSAEEWAHLFTGARHFRPDLSFCVVVDGDGGRGGEPGQEVVAIALSQVYPEDFAALGWTEAWLGQLGTRRAWRGRGLASALLRRSLVAYRDAGFDRAVLSVDSANPSGALALYERQGFRTRLRTITFGKPLSAR